MYKNQKYTPPFYADNSDRNTRIYVGQNAGKFLEKDILNAEKEVLIISPYVSKDKIEELINLSIKGVKVRLAFDFNIANQKKEEYKQILKKLILQEKKYDTEKQKTVERNDKKYATYSKLALFVGAILGMICIFNFHCLTLLLISLFFSKKYHSKRQENKKIRTYIYEYRKTIDFKCFWGDNLFHSKIYIIDNKVAYIGSLNFTYNGFNNNFETIIEINNQSKINELREFVNHIFDDNYRHKSHDFNFLIYKGYYDFLNSYEDYKNYYKKENKC